MILLSKRDKFLFEWIYLCLLMLRMCWEDVLFNVEISWRQTSFEWCVRIVVEAREEKMFVIVFLILKNKLKKESDSSYERINSHWIIINLRCFKKIFLNLLWERKEKKVLLWLTFIVNISWKLIQESFSWYVLKKSKNDYFHNRIDND